jgi:glucosamine kinase
MPTSYLLLADSGSTKTDWRLLFPDGRIAQARTQGITPTFQDTATIEGILHSELSSQLTAEAINALPSEIWFYGSGCGTPAKRETVAGAFRSVFPAANVHVEHDMLAAARALCGTEPGIACILGTGSNTCLFDGQEIVMQMPNLGFWLGDEGSGGHLGKMLLMSYLNQELPTELVEKFEKRYGLTSDEIIHKVYREPMPNRFMATFSKFLFDNRRDPFIYGLIEQSFTAFFQKTVCRYPDFEKLPVHCVGSVAFYYMDPLRRVAKSLGISVQRILETPIAGLTLYHQEKMGINAKE